MPLEPLGGWRLERGSVKPPRKWLQPRTPYRPPSDDRFCFPSYKTPTTPFVILLTLHRHPTTDFCHSSYTPSPTTRFVIPLTTLCNPICHSSYKPNVASICHSSYKSTVAPVCHSSYKSNTVGGFVIPLTTPASPTGLFSYLQNPPHWQVCFPAYKKPIADGFVFPLTKPTRRSFCLSSYKTRTVNRSVFLPTKPKPPKVLFFQLQNRPKNLWGEEKQTRERQGLELPSPAFHGFTHFSVFPFLSVTLPFALPSLFSPKQNAEPQPYPPLIFLQPRIEPCCQYKWQSGEVQVEILVHIPSRTKPKKVEKKSRNGGD